MRRAWVPWIALSLSLSALVLGCSTAASDVGAGISNDGDAGGSDFGGSGTGAGVGAGGPSNTAEAGSNRASTGAGESGRDGAGASGSGTAGGADSTTELCPGFNPERASPVLYMSADDSNSMASPALVRALIRQHGVAPDPSYVRPWEFLNYYRAAYTDDAPSVGKLKIVPSAAPLDGSDTDVLLQIGVRSHDAPKSRRAMVITLVVDTSGSMSGVGMTRARKVITSLGKTLRKGDIVNLVTWSTANATALGGHVVAKANDPALLEAAAALEAAGESDLHGGLEAGYALAEKHFSPDKLNRLVLISDGGANVGVTDQARIAEAAKKGDDEGIYLVGVGVGPALGFNEHLMNVVTDRGRGAYVYLDDDAEADRLFVDRFDEVMDVAARSVRLELQLPWYLEIVKFSGEEYAPDPKVIEPQHLAPGDAMIFNQVVRACSLDALGENEPVRATVTWEEPGTHKPHKTEMEVPLAALLVDDADDAPLAKASAIVAAAEAIRSGDGDGLAAAHAKLEAAIAVKEDPELVELAELLAEHPAFPE